MNRAYSKDKQYGKRQIRSCTGIACIIRTQIQLFIFILMNRNIEKLLAISSKPVRKIIGLMSGTSVDGLDVALCQIAGCGLQTKLELLQFETIPFEEHFKNEIKSIFSKKEVDLEKLTLLNPAIALKHASIINSLLQKWGIKNEEVDLVASHGQSIYHAPKSLHGKAEYGNATLQIGDGDHLAVATGIITLSDFRQKHIAAGGEGAPLAVYGDYLLFGKKNEDRLLLNIGGIANFTFLPGKQEAGNLLCTDLGPGNTIMDVYIQQNFPGKYFDEDAVVAKAGNINEALLAKLKDSPFFEQPFPKTTGPELFNMEYLQQAQERSGSVSLSANDIMATLNKFSADMIVDAVKKCIPGNRSLKIFSSGGGIHNPLLMQHMKDQLPGCEFYDTAELNIYPDAKEAVLFAVLANETICGDGNPVNGLLNITMGKISFPS